MPRKSLVDQVAEEVLDQIVKGELTVGGPLPTEAELCAAHDVSRVTLREAMKLLQAQRVVRAVPGVGGFVNPVAQWTGLEAVLRATSAGAGADRTSLQLVEVRQMIETGAAALAAVRHTPADLDALTRTLGEMRAAHRAGDVSAFVRADIEFHEVVLRATGNVFVALLLDPLSRILREKREQTSTVPQIQANALVAHAGVLAAVRSRDPDRARDAMDAHMQQTAADLRRYVLRWPQDPRPDGGHAPARGEEPDTRRRSPPVDERSLLQQHRPPVSVPAERVAAAVARSGTVLVVLDDDPTGTQSVAGLPVLTSWDEDDLSWAFARGAPAVYVLTNTRSLAPAEAAERNRQVVVAALAAAALTGTRVSFVSRGDSTLRGHFPLETDTLAAALAEHADRTVDAVVLVPAFPDAGRVTIGGSHYLRTADGLLPVGESEFAADATFGYRSSHLPAWVEEKTRGRTRAEDVVLLDLSVVRAGPDAVAALLAPLTGGTVVVADAVTEDDLRSLSLGLLQAEADGEELLYRVGPPFVRARAGQEVHPPLVAADVFGPGGGRPGGGLVVVGSHVGQTSRQLALLLADRPAAHVAVLDAVAVLDPARDTEHLASVVDEVVRGLGRGDVVLHTSRDVQRSGDPQESLAMSRRVSAAVVTVVQRVLAVHPPRFVVAKGGITSSDVAAHGLGIRRALVRGPMLPGIVSLWEPVGGPADGIPYVVFAGNVGDDDALAAVVRTLGSTPDVRSSS